MVFLHCLKDLESFLVEHLRDIKLQINITPNKVMKNRDALLSYDEEMGYMLAISDKLPLPEISNVILHNTAHILEWKKLNMDFGDTEEHSSLFNSINKHLKYKLYKSTSMHVDDLVIDGEIILKTNYIT